MSKECRGWKGLRALSSCISELVESSLRTFAKHCMLDQPLKFNSPDPGVERLFVNSVMVYAQFMFSPDVF